MSRSHNDKAEPPGDAAEKPQGGLLWDNEILTAPEDLQLGHFVARMDVPWLKAPFLLAGALIDSEEQRSWFVDHCDWVVIDLLRSRNQHQPRPLKGPSHQPSRNLLDSGNPNAPVNMLRRAELDHRSVVAAIEGHDLLHRRAGALMESIQRNGRIDVEAARLDARQIAESLEQNIAAMIWLTRIKNHDQYTAEHCVNVAILSIGVAKALNWDADEVEQAGLAGLLHDLGKMKLDQSILNKPGRLTPEEHAHIREHSRLGYELLKDDDSVSAVVRRAVLEHHERPDGQGYPIGRDRDSQLPLASLVCVVDAYDAITSVRPYSPARSHHEALGILWKGRDKQFDATMVQALIEFLGWITPGTLVRLSDSGFAVVLKATAEHRLWPVVRRLVADGEQYRATDVIDLASHNSANPEIAIRVAEVLPDGALDVDLDAVLREAGQLRAVAEPAANG